MALTTEMTLKLLSRCWGKQDGYVFFPWIDGSAEDKAQRIRGYNEGPAFKWPADREKIITHIDAHEGDDLYFCPNIFETRVRRLDQAMDEHCLYADLDAVDPREIDEEFKPTIAWESSPGKFQAVWLITGGDIQGATWPGNENQRLTYYLGADHSGWDTTQLLRVPGKLNHKPAYKEANEGEPVPGQLLWHNGRRYLADEFDGLPEVRGVGNVESDALEEAIEAVDRLNTWGKTRLKVSKDVRELVSARATGGNDRSEKLWQIERDLADAGLTVPEIVSIVRETVWNKFSGRNDELRRLVTEASKAVSERPAEVITSLEKLREEKPTPGNLFTMVKNAPLPVWLVKDIVTEGSCGFMAGEPKSYKSWAALDLALSVATGTPFLNAFDVLQPGPVLYIQEEDPLPTLKDRLAKMAPGKTRDHITSERGPDGEYMLVWEPAPEMNDGAGLPHINAIVREQFVISDQGWQAWLDEVLAEGYGDEHEPYKLLVIDPLMMVAGEVEENRAQEMTTKIFGPMKQLAAKHNVAVQVVHHMAKAREDSQRRGGQRMLGSVANHAWSESSLYFTHGRLGTMNVETESKSAASIRFEIKGLRKKTSVNALTWDPEVNVLGEEESLQGAVGSAGKRSTGQRSNAGKPPAQRAVRIGQGTRKMLARSLDLDENASQTAVRAAWEEQGGIWGEFGDLVNSRGGPAVGTGGTPGRRPDPDPAALKALRKLTQRQSRPYTTNEIKDEMAVQSQQKPTQTLYLRAYQQLKKLMDNDVITRVEKDWAMFDVSSDDLVEKEIEDLI